MPSSIRLLGLIAAIAATMSLTLGSHTALAAPTGQDLFQKCINCHGQQGHGNQLYLAPGIAGLPSWYVELQLTNFKQNIRGNHYDDIAGHRMRPMARMLKTQAEIGSVAKYVATLKPAPVKPVLDGDPGAGQAAYVTCTACHGADGKGNQALGAPDIRFTGDWYLLAQLKKFKSGKRGANPKDIKGATMRPMAMTLANEQAMKDVIAYIMTLAKTRK